MSLAVDFYIPGDEVPILDMPCHSEFLEMLSSQPTRPVRAGINDFWIDSEVLAGAEEMLAQQLFATGFTELPMVWEGDSVDCRPENCSPATLWSLYTNAFQILRNAVAEHGPLICVWSVRRAARWGFACR